MTKRNDKSGSPLPPTKTVKQTINNGTLHAKLTALDQQLDNLLHSQQFYHQALISLLESEDQSSCLIGALAINQWLRQSGESLLVQLRELEPS